MRIYSQDMTYTLKGYNAYVQTLDEDDPIYDNRFRYQFNLNPFLLNIYSTLTDTPEKYNQFHIDFARNLYKELSPLFYIATYNSQWEAVAIQKINEEYMTLKKSYIVLKGEIPGQNVGQGIPGFIPPMERGVVFLGGGVEELRVIAFDFTKTNWNKYFYPFLKIVNTSLIKLLLNRSELYQTLDALSKTMDYRGIFIDDNLLEGLKRRKLLDDFNSNELARDALSKVSQFLYKKYLTETGLPMSETTLQAFRGDLPPDLIARLKREMDEQSDTLN